MRECSLTSVSNNIALLSNLQKLDLSYNNDLIDLPEALLRLPSTCEIDLTGCGISIAHLRALQEMIEAPSYVGPRFIHSVVEVSRPLAPEMSISVLMQELCNVSGTSINLAGLINSGDEGRKLHVWLSRFSSIADYNKGGETKKQLASNVLTYLKLAAADPEFRKTFYLVIEDAAKTCGDRMALSLLDLGIAHDLNKIETDDIFRLGDFLLKGVFIMGLLQDLARIKIETLVMADPIEVYLGYPVMLKERLHLPINTTTMLYSACSGITPEDLNYAESYVNSKLTNGYEVVSFLITQDKWREALRKKFPEGVLALDNAKRASSEAAISDSDYTEIEEKFTEGLKTLTRQVIGFSQVGKKRKNDEVTQLR